MTVRTAIIRLMFFISLFAIPLQTAAFEHFITADGSRLMDGSRPLRFISFNIPNINFVEDEMIFERTHPFNLPTAYEMEDAMVSVRQMGGSVIRSYTIPVRRETDTPDIPRYVLAPGQFDERAFVTMDTMLALANETGVRVIVSLLNAWKWMGGRPQYAGFRGKTEEAFWTDPQLIDDFKKTVAFVINRTNTVTGVPYREDKAILCWETGNELPCPHSWTNTIATYIKQLDRNHLVMDGYNAFNERLIREEAVLDPAVDIVTSHHYETNPADVLINIDANRWLIQGRKPYLVGEFGFLSTSGLKQIMNHIIRHEDIIGGLIWSLRYHRHHGGFYWHSEPLGYGLYKAYHWPGFNSGNEYDEKNLLSVLRENAFIIQGKTAPPVPVPESPRLLSITNVASVSWQGSAGASGYEVQRSQSPDGPWEIIGRNISDAAVQYRPLFNDRTASLGSVFYYRVLAENHSGQSAPSNVVGPVKVTELGLTDEMENLMIAYHVEGDMAFQTDDDRKYKEDRVRLQCEEGSRLLYYTPGSLTRMKIFVFAESEEPTLRFYRSEDNRSYIPVQAGRTSYYSGSGDYAYWRPVLYESRQPELSGQYLKIDVLKRTQVSRIELYYGK